ncbi:MAG TPA: molybdenum cofactor guanylyltransferase [Bacilli bacterium]
MLKETGNKSLTGAILAGGENRRMNGQAKALLPFSGELLIERQIRELQRICSEVMVVTNEPELYLPILDSAVRVISDIYPRNGPLSGIHSVLTQSSYEDVWIVACDMPFISAKAAKWMQVRKSELKVDAVIPISFTKIHSLHGIFTKCCMEPISGMLEAGEYHVMELLKKVNWFAADEIFFHEKGLDMIFTTNVNTYEDYLQALILLQGLDV